MAGKIPWYTWFPPRPALDFSGFDAGVPVRRRRLPEEARRLLRLGGFRVQETPLTHDHHREE